MSTLHYCINILMVAVLSVIIGIWHQDSPDEDGASCSLSGDTAKPPVSPVDSSIEKSSVVGEVPREVTGYENVSRENKDDGGGNVQTSSVICWGSHHTNRTCHFRNLYYLPREDEFVFVHGEDTLVSGVPVDRYSPALMDLSSVADHNLAYFNYADVALDKARTLLGNSTVVDGLSLVFRRFHADNLMHVFHDDLLPVFHTLQLMRLTSSTKQSSDDVQLVFMEGWSPGPYEDLYRIFSRLPPLYRQDLRAAERPVRFPDVRVGLSKHTTWYQYGFTTPQGPINGSGVTAGDIRRFTRLVRRELNISDDPERAVNNKLGRTIVLLKREDTRLILNEFELSNSLAQRLRAKVVIVAAETHSVREIIEVITGADVLVGMHGSLLVLAMFLPRGATVIELFPYAVNPAHYTPYRTLAELPGMHLRYAAWRNTDESKSVAHPSRPPEQGGLLHLPLADRRRITESGEVPPHLCCTDPEWLYRIYQDTFVDVNAVVHLVETTSNLSNTRAISPRDGTLLFPSRVRHPTCLSSSDASRIADGEEGAIGLTVSWKEPVNLAMIAYGRVQYEVWIQESGPADVDYVAWMLDMTEYRFTTGLKASTTYNVWIRCVLDEGGVGPFNLEQITCST